MIKLLKSYKFWTALAGSVGLFLTSMSEQLGIYINANGVKEAIMVLCSALVAFGIIKKPTNTSQTKSFNTQQNDQNQNQDDKK